MTDKEIVQALRCCAKGLGQDDACENCKVGEIQDRREYIEFAAANVIERLTAENAELRKEIEWKDMVISLAQREQAKALDAADLIDRLTAENAALRKNVPQWISVEDRLRELAEADKDGRVVVLPCKVGDTVWRIVRDGELHITRDEVRDMCFADDMTLCVELIGGRVTFTEKFGKTVFLSREEAERAMEGRKND